jgi:hypothetical protein
MLKAYDRAIFKFNNGNGALLCNRCRIIIATGNEHEDIEHYCEACRSLAGRTAIRVAELSDDEMLAIMDAKVPPEADYDGE